MDDNDRALTAFTMLGHGTFHSYELVIPVFVVIWLDVFATTAATLGLVVGASYALVGLGAIPSGMLADRFSARRVVLICLLGMGLAFLLVALAPNVVVLALGLLMWGLAASLYHPAALALISRGTKARGSAFAYHGMAGNVGVVTGPLLASLLLLGFHWRVVAAVMMAPAVLATLVGFALAFDETAGAVTRDGQDDDVERNLGGSQPESLAAFRSESKRLFTAGFLVVFAIGMLYGIYYRGLFTFLPEVLADLSLFDPVERFGRSFEPSQYVYSGLLLLGAVGQYAGGKLVERVPIERALLGTYLALVVVAVLFVPATGALASLLVVAGLVGFFVFMTAPINQEAIAAYSAPELRGLSYGYTYTAIFGLGAFGATLAGVILTRWSSGVLFAVLAGCSGLAAVLGGLLVVRAEKGSP
jgi:MFS family permease